jgi:hypothetical protein
VRVEDCSGNRRPGLADSEDTLNIVALNLLTRHGVNDDKVNAKEGEGGGTRLHGDDTGKRSNNVRAGLSLPVGIRDMAVVVTNVLIVPFPNLRGNRFTDRTQSSQRRQIMLLNVVFTSTLQETKSSRGNIELSDLVLLNDLPVSRVGGVSRGTLEDNGSGTKEQRTVEGVGVAGNPTDITGSEKSIIRVNVKHIFAGSSGTKEETTGDMDDTLGGTSRTGSVKQEQRILSRNRSRSNIRSVLSNLLVPPEITTGSPGNLVTSALVDKNLLNRRSLLETLIDNLLSVDGLATTLTFISGDNNLALGIVDSILEGAGRETSKNDGMDSTNSRDSQKGNKSFGNHGQVNGNRVTLLDTKALKDTSNLANLTEELTVGDLARVSSIISLVDNGNLKEIIVRTCGLYN